MLRCRVRPNNSTVVMCEEQIDMQIDDEIILTRYAFVSEYICVELKCIGIHSALPG